MNKKQEEFILYLLARCIAVNGGNPQKAEDYIKSTFNELGDVE